MCRFTVILLCFICNAFVVFSQAARQGKDYAVFFAVADFEPGWEPLPETVKESKAIKEELELNYGFQCELVVNPSKLKIRDKIREYNKTVTKDDQVLFFFSMHGYYNEKSDLGFLIAKDGKKNDFQYGDSWLKYPDIISELTHYNAKHIMLALDACNSGSFGIRSKGGKPKGFAKIGDDCSTKIAHAMEKTARQFCAAGNKYEKAPAESLFAAKFLKSLKELPQDEILYFDDLYAKLRRVNNPRPVGGTFRGDEDGTGFFFLRKNACAVEAAPTPPADPEQALWDNAVKKNTIADYEYYLLRYPFGKYKNDAVAEKEWLLTVKHNKCSGYQYYVSTYKRHKKAAEEKCPDLFSSTPRPTKSLDLTSNMVFVEGGSFKMGSSNGDTDEQPVHTVNLSDFYISKYEVTQREWKKIMKKNPTYLKFKGCDECPVDNVSWKDAVTFIRKLNNQTGENYRLPTEAEWEYAARGGKYASAQTQNINVNNVAWYIKNADRKTQPIGSKLPNKLGLHDMFGNVYEWCSDWYGIYTPDPKTDPLGIEYSSTKVCRGGSHSDAEKNVSITNRGNSTPDSGTEYIGFRLAKSAEN